MSTTAEIATDLLLHDGESGDVARSATVGRNAARDLERDIAPDPVVESPRRDPVVAQLDRSSRDERRIARAHH